MTTGADLGEDGGRHHQGHGGTVGEDEVNAGGGKTASRGRVLERPGQGRGQQAGVDIDPSTPRPQQCGQQGTDREAVAVGATGNVQGGAEGAVEIAQEKSGNLHVEAVGQLQQGQDEASLLGGLG